ncbi:MAG: 7-cyano-7-deazaguanine synthase [Actinomycetia bacterium]|nr:7-cyano-7-deazaguanine synthase [Actinomycetes bacterium]
MKIYTVVVNDCATVGAPGGPRQIRTRQTSYGPQNFMLGYDKLAAGLSRALTERELDWIESAGHIFAADMACERDGGDLDWARSIDLHLPVRDVVYWNALSKRIAHIVSDFTGDRITISFHQETDPMKAPRQRRGPFGQHDCVALLSGGVDSFVGAASLLVGGSVPLFLSHTAAGSITHAQTQVHSALNALGTVTDRVGLTAQKRGNFPGSEQSQRTRSFFFLAAATLASSVDGCGPVFINENGVMALHLPLTTARIGSLSTHTASPDILERVEALAGEVLGRDVSISNNLVGLTKPEVVELGVQCGLSKALRETVSCWSIGRTSEHCGVCVPCLIRRISFDSHNVPDSPYTMDIFGDPDALTATGARDNLAHMIRHVDHLGGLSELDMQIAFPELLNGGSALPLDQAIDLQRRWATQATKILLSNPVPKSIW